MAFRESDVVLAFKAGRAFRREGTNIVEPSPTKGAIYLTNGEDGLLHFIWKNRDTNTIEEDLILFPSDASFVKVSQSPSGRVYVLKFSSSNQRHFFWMQDASAARDREFSQNLDGMLQDPDYDIRWNVPIVYTGTSPASTPAQPPAISSASSSTSPANNPANFEATPEQLAALQSILRNVNYGAATQQPIDDVSLTDILTPANLLPLFNSRPDLVPALFPHLPPDLPVPASDQVLQRIIHSPQFRAAVSNFDQALRTGLLGGLVRSLGLPEEAGRGVGPFLRAIQEQADRERNSSMDTD